jgi:hypothetical protein
MLVAAGIGILASKRAFSQDAGEFGKRHYQGTRRVWHDRLVRQQLAIGQIVGVVAIVVGVASFAIALL